MVRSYVAFTASTWITSNNATFMTPKDEQTIISPASQHFAVVGLRVAITLRQG